MDSYALKLLRAREHLATLERDVASFLKAEPGKVVSDFDVFSRRITMTFRVERQPPEEWGPLIGDFLFNLRSSLDHIVYQMTVRQGGHELRMTAFPIYEGADAYAATGK